MATKKKLLQMKQPESIDAKLERIACDYRDEVEVAIENLNAELENNLTVLVEEFGYKAVEAAVNAIEDNLRGEFEPQTSLREAFECVSESEPDEKREDG
jgi:hypothetical protein